MSESKPVLTPAGCVDHDVARTRSIEIELPGVTKNNIDLEISEQGFYVKRKHDNDVLSGCLFLSHPVNTDKAIAKFESGLLKISVTLEHPLKGKKLKIE